VFLVLLVLQAGVSFQGASQVISLVAEFFGLSFQSKRIQAHRAARSLISAQESG
jgi:hypothetical protein